MRLGTRRSTLALAQAQLVADMLGGCEIVPLVTGGDRPRQPGCGAAGSAGSIPRQAVPRQAGAEDKSRWVDELERALSEHEIDLAVHSAKDLPGELADGLELLGAPARAGVEDVLCGARALDELPDGARVGTSSIRRVAQLRAARADLDVVALHGNVDTRLARLAGGEHALDAILLARAGLQRLGREPDAGAVLDPARFVPAPGQGTLVLEGRADDERARAAVRAINDEVTYSCLLAERALARDLDANCHTPLGAWAAPTDDGALHLHAWVGLPDGSAWASDDRLGAPSQAEELAHEVAGRLRAIGADELLARARSA